jgi:serine-type D-Ala-D-Ala carboxypeptidase (penicillin-binding protein 5/6)
MKAVSHLLTLILPVAFLASAPARAQDAVMPAAPALPARAYVLYDCTSNQILVSENGHQRLAPAALAKLMTAYVALNAVKERQFALSQTAYPSLQAIRPQDDEARMYLDHNKAVTVDELLHGLIVGSSDDAVRVLVDLISGDEGAFAAQMNRQAQLLGMRDTHFTNAGGKPDPQQYSSAYDLALLAVALRRDFPEHYALYGQREYVHDDITVFNNNRLLWIDPYVDGIKTGLDPRTGYGVAASGERENRRLIAVVLGAPSDKLRYSASEELLNYGFRNFEAMPLYRKNQPVGSLRVWKGASPMVNVGFPDGLSLTVPMHRMPQFRATLASHQPIVAPVAAGQPLGVLKLSLQGKPYAEFPVVALDPVPAANVFSRGWDAIRLMFQ